MTDDPSPLPPSVSTIETNSRGIAILPHANRPVIIDHITRGTKMLECRDLETHAFYSIHRSSFMPAITIPSKHRKHNFDAVAPLWAQALNAYPKFITINPGNNALETIARKLREGRVAKDLYAYTHHLIDEALWKQYSAAISITITASGIILGDKNAKQVEADSKPLTATIISANEIEIKWRTIDELERFLYMQSNKMFTPQPAFVIPNLDPSMVENIESRYDIALAPVEGDATKWRVL